MYNDSDKTNLWDDQGEPSSGGVGDENQPSQDSALTAPGSSRPAGETRKRSGSGWRTFIAALVLVAVGAGVGSATTWLAVRQLVEANTPVGLTGSSADAKSVAAGPLEEGTESVIPEIYRRVVPSVVLIKVEGLNGSGSGSGFVVDPQGYILTNYHVVSGARQIEVRFVDGTTLKGKVLGTDRSQDLAVIKVDPGDQSLVAAPLGDSDSVQIGELAIAIGSPFDNDFSLTAGVVSALDRDLIEENNVLIKGAIQTDAAINPGNSGGPLLNSRGEVIGINTAIENVAGRFNVGIGFAVPINAAKNVLPDLVAGRQEPYLGVRLQDLTADDANNLGLSVSEGALVVEVVQGGPAHKAGLRGPVTNFYGRLVSVDVIVAIDDKPVKGADEVVRAINSKNVGDTIKVTVVRGEQQETVTAELMPRPLD